ncbi:MAG: porin [Alphaproteobacteria bacterium]
MRRALITTTAIVAVGAWAGAAAAQAQVARQQQPLRLGIGGYFAAYGVYVDQPDGPGEYGEARRRFDLKRDAEVWIKGSVALDNGIRIGAEVQIEGQTEAEQVDQSYLLVESAWGSLRIGASKSASYLLSTTPPSVDPNFDGIDPNFRLTNALGPLATQNQASDFWSPTFTFDAEKVTYTSPRIAGFQAGISYTPDNAQEAIKGGSFLGMPSNRESLPGRAAWSDIVSVGGYYMNEHATIGHAICVGWEHGSLSRCPVGVSCLGFQDRDVWGVYGVVWYDRYVLGGGYRKDDNGLSGDNDSTAWGLGFNYVMAPLTLGVSWLESRRSFPGVKDDRLQRVLVGGRYAYGPGMDLRASVHWYGLDSAKPTAEGDSWAVVLGTVVNF